MVDLPEDGVANDVLTLNFAASKTPVQFIKLKLFDESGKQVGDNFYWRSDNEYKGANTLTRPGDSRISVARETRQNQSRRGL